MSVLWQAKAVSPICVRDDALLSAVAISGIQENAISVDTRKEGGMNPQNYGRAMVTLVVVDCSLLPMWPAGVSFLGGIPYKDLRIGICGSGGLL